MGDEPTYTKDELDEAYAQGYEDGRCDGYNDGYDQGVVEATEPR